jgi:DNA-binding CsgD family transcriptional regulator
MTVPPWDAGEALKLPPKLAARSSRLRSPRPRVGELGRPRPLSITRRRRPVCFPASTKTSTRDASACSEEIVEAVHFVAKGQSLLDPAVTGRVLERLRKGPKEDELLAQLSPQERNILNLIADGLTNRQIAEQIHLAEKTVKNYVSNLLSKLGMERRTQAAVYAARLTEQRGEGPAE